MTRRDLFRSIATAIVAQGVSQQTGSAVAPTPPIEPDMYPLSALNLQLDWSVEAVDVSEPASPFAQLRGLQADLSASMELTPGDSPSGPIIWCARDLNHLDALMELFLAGEMEEFELTISAGERLRFRGMIQSIAGRDLGVGPLPGAIDITIAGQTMRA